MNQGDYARTLNNKDLVEWGIKFFRKDWDDASVVMCDSELKEVSIQILNKPYETTADEDFLEHNLKFHTKHSDCHCIEYVIYRTINKDILDMEVYITPTETRLRIFPQKEVVFVNLEENQIRKIADKKRKEMGWGE